MSEDSKECTRIALDACFKNKYPHRMGRLGYAGLREKVKNKKKQENKDPDEPISRATLWKLARQNENGEYKSDDISSTAKKIDECSMKIDDILSRMRLMKMPSPML